MTDRDPLEEARELRELAVREILDLWLDGVLDVYETAERLRRVEGEER